VKDAVLKLGIPVWYTSIVGSQGRWNYRPTATCFCHISWRLPYVISELAILYLRKQCPSVYGVEHAMFSDINISQGSVMTPLRCGKIRNKHFITNFLTSVIAKEL